MSIAIPSRGDPLPHSVAACNDDVLYRRISWRLIPMLFIGYMVSYLDRTNVGYAQLQMRETLAFGDVVFGLGAAAFFVGYMLFEIPSNLLLVRIGIKKTMLRIMLLWGLASMATMWVGTERQFYFVRFLVGVFEAGFVPGVLYYLTLWYPVQRRGRATALFFMGFAVAPIVAGPVAGAVMTYMQGLGGLQGWQWLFVVEGIPALVLALVCWRWMDDKPADATWLSPQERDRVAALLTEDARHAHMPKKWYAGLNDSRAWGLGLVSFLLVCSIFALTFWQPTLLKGMGLSLMQVGLAAVVPAVASAVAALWLGGRSDRLRERRWHLTVSALIAALGMVLTAVFTTNVVAAVLSLALATAGLAAAMAILYASPGEVLPGASLPAGIALITTLSNCGGVVAPLLVAKLKEATGGFTLSLLILAGGLVLAAVVFQAVLGSRRT